MIVFQVKYVCYQTPPIISKEYITIEKEGEDDLSIDMRKNARTYVKPLPYSIKNYLYYGKASFVYRSFLSALNYTALPNRRITLIFLLETCSRRRDATLVKKHGKGTI